jgi:hypothetical protein
MKYLLLLATLLILPSFAHSQAIAFEQGPVISVTGSASYIYGESEGRHNFSLWGWGVSPEMNLTRRFGMQASFGNFIEEGISPGQRRLILTAGPRYSLPPVYRIRPFVYAEAGEMKLSFNHTAYTDWDPVARIGIGFEYHLLRNVSFTLVPAEYLAHNVDSGGWEHDFSAHAGFTMNFYTRAHEK